MTKFYRVETSVTFLEDGTWASDVITYATEEDFDNEDGEVTIINWTTGFVDGLECCADYVNGLLDGSIKFDENVDTDVDN